MKMISKYFPVTMAPHLLVMKRANKFLCSLLDAVFEQHVAATDDAESVIIKHDCCLGAFRDDWCISAFVRLYAQAWWSGRTSAQPISNNCYICHTLVAMTANAIEGMKADRRMAPAL
jgi:hypothetical protein